jgi:hypothetical protein
LLAFHELSKRTAVSEPIDQARRHLASGHLADAIRALQTLGATGERQDFEAVAAMAADIRGKTSKRREQSQCDALIAHAGSSLLRLDNPVSAAATRAAQPVAVVAGCRVLGGHGLDLAVGTLLNMRFLLTRIDLAPLGVDQRVPVAYDDIVAFEIGGPGAHKSGGGFFGGGFGLQGLPKGCWLLAP